MIERELITCRTSFTNHQVDGNTTQSHPHAVKYLEISPSDDNFCPNKAHDRLREYWAKKTQNNDGRDGRSSA